MDRLNYFNPYQTKEPNHEDQLTRAYLVLLKHSFHSFSAFLSYVNKKNENENKFEFIDLIESGWSFETQIQNPDIETSFVASILITDDDLNKQIEINASGRNARYDGIITFGSLLTFVIENKPRSQNVWFDQLNPSRNNLSEETQILKSPIVLEWKEIINHLNLLKSIDTINGFEKIMIEDFLNYIDSKFPYLNPFDNFVLCKSNTELLKRRIKNFLKEIAIDENSIGYHNKNDFGYFIKTPDFDAIKKIGLPLKQDENDWRLELSLNFGDTQSQAKSFYKRDPNLSILNDYWSCYTNFHLSFASSNLIWFQRKENNKSSSYLDYWKSHISSIHQYSKDKIEGLINDLASKEVINLDDGKNQELYKEIYNTKRNNINICPGFIAITKIPSNICKEKDKKNELTYYIAQQIKNGLQIVNYDCEKILKKEFCH